MKKKLLIGSLLAAFMLVTLPGVSAVENVEVETIKNTPVSKGAISSLILQLAEFIGDLINSTLHTITTFSDPAQDALENILGQFWDILQQIFGFAADLIEQIL